VGQHQPLFELIAHRYERKSLMITANQPFCDWDSIFADSMMTVAAIDRLVHHAVILEIQAPSYRQQAALKQAKEAKAGKPRQFKSEVQPILMYWKRILQMVCDSQVTFAVDD
jgi:IstB-like ATP binding protein